MNRENTRSTDKAMNRENTRSTDKECLHRCDLKQTRDVFSLATQGFDLELIFLVVCIMNLSDLLSAHMKSEKMNNEKR